MTALLTDRFNSALLYAATAHQNQTRKGTHIPYLSHLLTVAAIVLEEGGDEDEAIAALLHDVVEDAGGQGRLADVKEVFGPRVADIVLGCTDTDTDPNAPAPCAQFARMGTDPRKLPFVWRWFVLV